MHLESLRALTCMHVNNNADVDDDSLLTDWHMHRRPYVEQVTTWAT